MTNFAYELDGLVEIVKAEEEFNKGDE
jgi:hypothetical protein